jgi:hypothetical protein
MRARIGNEAAARITLACSGAVGMLHPRRAMRAAPRCSAASPPLARGLQPQQQCRQTSHSQRQQQQHAPPCCSGPRPRRMRLVAAAGEGVAGGSGAATVDVERAKVGPPGTGRRRPRAGPAQRLLTTRPCLSLRATATPTRATPTRLCPRPCAHARPCSTARAGACWTCGEPRSTTPPASPSPRASAQTSPGAAQRAPAPSRPRWVLRVLARARFGVAVREPQRRWPPPACGWCSVPVRRRRTLLLLLRGKGRAECRHTT